MIFYVLGFPWIQATETSVSKTHLTYFQNQPAPHGISFEDMTFAFSMLHLSTSSFILLWP